MSAIGAAATIIGASFAWVVSSGRLVPPFGLIFVTGAGATLVAAVLFWRMRDIGRQTKRPRLIVRRRYWLYYVLCLLFGARKQMFVTFGPWVLIKVFNRQVSTFAKLGIISSLLTVFTNPMIGNLIDRWGERKILVVDSLVLLLICLGYGGAHWLGPSGVYLVFLCFIMDDVMFGVGNARSTYLAKIAEKPEHVTASLSLGVSLDHAVSMSLPTLGGYVWVHYGHSWVFFGAGAIALLMMIFSALIKLPQAPAAASGEAVGSASAAE
jgi:predicted MFS family arabinose efflux permease